MPAPKTWLSAVLGLTTSPQSCTATSLFMCDDAGFDVDRDIGHLDPARRPAMMRPSRGRYG